MNDISPYISAFQNITEGATMPKIDYSSINSYEDAEAVKQQAKQRSSKIGQGLGSAAGAAIGTFLLPGIGTALGAAIGGGAGGLFGNLFGGNPQAKKAEAIAKERESKMNAIVQARFDRANENALFSNNTIYQSF